MSGGRIEDARSAQAAVRRYLISQYGKGRINNINFSRAWYQTGSKRDVWEVEGDVVLKKRWLRKEEHHFKFQVDPDTGRVIAFEI